MLVYSHVIKVFYLDADKLIAGISMLKMPPWFY